MVFGEYDGSESPRAKRLLEALLESGVQAELSRDIRRTLWEKYVFLVGLSGSTATVRTPLGPVRSNPRSRSFLHDLMRETVDVGRALGIDLPADYADQRLAFADTLPADMSSSLHHDLERGGRLEVEWLSGGVVQLGQSVNVPTPCNRAVWDILSVHAEGRRP
jgi:2-dehydropantoate 2-reductase